MNQVTSTISFIFCLFILCSPSFANSCLGATDKFEEWQKQIIANQCKILSELSELREDMNDLKKNQSSAGNAAQFGNVSKNPLSLYVPYPGNVTRGNPCEERNIEAKACYEYVNNLIIKACNEIECLSKLNGNIDFLSNEVTHSKEIMEYFIKNQNAVDFGTSGLSLKFGSTR